MSKFQEAFEAMRDVLKEFVERCDQGLVRSVYTYARAKEALLRAREVEREESGETEWPGGPGC